MNKYHDLNNLTYINNIKIICDENIYQTEDIMLNLNHTYIARDMPYFIKLTNIKEPLLLNLNEIYTIRMKTGLTIIDHKLSSMAYKTIKNNYNNIIFLKAKARLIGYKMNELLFVIIME